MASKVFIYRPHAEWRDCAAVVFDEDGNELGAHISSGPGFVRGDTARFVPDGAEAVFCFGRAALQAHIDSGALRGVSFDAPQPAEESAP